MYRTKLTIVANKCGKKFKAKMLEAIVKHNVHACMSITNVDRGREMSMFEFLKNPDIILSLFLHKNWTGLILLAPTVYIHRVYKKSRQF